MRTGSATALVEKGRPIASDTKSWAHDFVVAAKRLTQPHKELAVPLITLRPRSSQRLRGAASAHDRARGAGDNPAAQPEEVLQGLLDGRWSIVDTFEQAGRCLLVAHQNEPAIARTRRLTRRERQVVTSIGCGTCERLTALALRLSVSTVRTHLSRALRKLGLRHATGLVELMWHLRS